MNKVYFVGAPTRAKGIEDFNLLAGQLKNIEFYWFCFILDPAIKKKYENIKFVVGLKDRSLRKKIRKMNLFVCCSHFEGFCLPIAEAILQNKPVLSYRLDELVSVFNDTIGYVKPFNIDIFRKKIYNYFLRGEYDGAVKKAKKLMLSEFSPEAVKNRFINAITS